MDEKKYDLIFRVDGGNAYGVAMGHAYRCRRLATLLRKRGIKCHFMMKNLPQGVKLIREAGFSVTVLSNTPTNKEIVSKVIKTTYDDNALLFIDLREDCEELITTAKNYDIKTILYEDVSLTDSNPDILINPSPICLDYQLAKKKLFLGLDYLMLSDELKAYALNHFSAQIKDLFVSFGGADPCNLSERITNLLLSRNDRFKVHLVLGPAYASMDSLRRTIENSNQPGRIDLYHNIENIYELAQKCDAAIVSGGTTMFELVSISVPCLVMPSIEHEADVANCLKNRGLVDSFNKDVELISDTDLDKKLDVFIMSSKKRSQLYHKTSEVDFISGTSKVADIVCGFIEYIP